MINPYVEWLGLTPTDDTPTYFQMFGLSQDEDRIEAITAASEAAMAKVRRCRPGEHAKSWANLLDELEDAKQTLTDDVKRAAYRHRLQSAKRFPPPASSGNSVAGESKSDSRDRPAAIKEAATIKVAETQHGDLGKSTKPRPSEVPTAQAFPPSRSPNGKLDRVNAAENTAPAQSAPLLKRNPAVPPASGNEDKTPRPILDRAKATSDGEAVSKAAAVELKPVTTDEIDPMAPVALPMPSNRLEATAASDVDSTSGTSNVLKRATPSSVDEDDPMAPFVAGASDPTESNEPEAKPSRTVSDQPVMIDEELRGTRNSSRGILLGVVGGGITTVLVFVAVAVWQSGWFQANESAEVADAGDAANASDNSTTTGTSTGLGTSTATGPNGSSGSNRSTPDADTQSAGDAETSTSSDSDGTGVGQTSQQPPAVNDGGDDSVDNGPADDPTGEDGPASRVDEGTMNVADDDMSADGDAPLEEDSTGTAGEVAAIASTADILAFGQGLAEVQQLLYERSTAEAMQRLQQVRQSPHREQDAELADRLELVGNLVSQFWESVESGAASLQAGEELMIGDNYVSVVEVNPDLLVLRYLGANHRSHPRALKPGLAMAIAARGLPESAAEARVIKGAYYAIERLDKPSLGDRAVEFWEEAELMGADVRNLLAYLEDDYDLAGSIIEQVAQPAADQIEAATAIVVAEIREEYGTISSNSQRRRVAEAMLASGPRSEDVARRYAMFVEAGNWAARAGDAPLVLTAAARLNAWFELEDPWQRKIEWMLQAARANGGPDASKEVARSAIEQAEMAIDDDRASEAEQLLQASLLAARQTRDEDFQETTQQRVETLREDLED